MNPYLDTFKVVLTDYTKPMELEQPKLDKIIKETNALVQILHNPNKTELEEALNDAVVALVHRVQITDDVLTNAPNLRLIVNLRIGLDNVDVQSASQHKVLVVNNPENCIHEVADHTLGLILTLLRKISQANEAARKKAFPATYDDTYLGTKLGGKVLGLVGFGNIAQLVAKRASAFGMSIIAYTPRLTSERARLGGATLASFDQLLSTADVISLHMPMNPDNFHMIGYDELKRMKSSAIIINTSRGKLIDENALDKALSEGIIGGAGLDVFEKEPLTPDNPLLRHTNCVVTPHTAWASPEALIDLEEVAARQVIQFYRGERPVFLVNPELWGKV